ncbi:hypothetical protein Psta_3431 [Pirellula staleyi DSM 6068]|uniref:Uncharacterized protein n=1 Tax=Pirellula staleyi (strain ATCC 27377 / DSM 6068 / ICPB 4128) TaxID=530564 RepID=D2QY17_PIRSD|nr:hypothetical protein [Pirellula staleyi]ADB18094.1 hypothetical protein Psta_3431 [Pirellula staleyi DSM 6068]
MPGEDSLLGLVYQQRYVQHRVLSQLALDAAKIVGGHAKLVRFVVEGRGGVVGPIWDILFEYSDGVLDLHECKNTTITKEDRLTFYDRLRREIAGGTAADRIHPVWVTDPGKQTANILGYLEGIPLAVCDVDLNRLPATLPKRLVSSKAALQEAVWRLCHYTGEKVSKKEATKAKRKKKIIPLSPESKWPRACTTGEAKTLLSNLRIARHRFEELDQSIKLLSTGVFATGTAASVQKFVTGVLTEEVVGKKKAEFTVPEFIATIGTATVEHSVGDVLRDLMTFSAASGFTRPAGRIVWRNLPGNPVTRWSLSERAPTYDSSRSECFVANMGCGKTVASQLAFDEEAKWRHASRTLRVEARALGQVQVDSLLQLSCLLCGLGPTWLAIDGLDEIPSSLSQQWIRVLAALTDLPNLTVLVTVRREVLAIQEWLETAIAPLHKVDLELLSISQVEQSFSEVKLPVPKNPQLIDALRNLYLLSLYADIVGPTDMPLAQSGEVTAFQVIEMFWQRRVRGVSTGQRAVGSSDVSQEAKRKAALFLGDQSLAGNLFLSRQGADEQTAQGIEMLLLEGVIREQGAAAVAWSHDWLREYSLVQTMLARIATPNAILLSRTIVAACTEDHVARSAAAAGLKWVMGNDTAGSTTEYLSELAMLNDGLAREALIVLLEGPATTGALSGLSDALVADALTLAVSLRVPHWSVEVAGLQDVRFLGPQGDRLQTAAVQYELTVCRAEGAGEPAVVKRLVKRELARWRLKLPCSRSTFRLLLDAIVASRAYGDPGIDEWLILVASASDSCSFGRLLELIGNLLTDGAVDLACKVFRATLGIDDAERGSIVTGALVTRRIPFERSLLKVIESPGLLLHLETWGRTAIELLAALIVARQRVGEDTRLSIAKEMGEESDKNFSPRFDEEPQLSVFSERDCQKPLVRVRAALDLALSELAIMPDATGFQAFTDGMLDTRFAALIILPMLSLLDAGNTSEKKRDWQDALRLQLLADARVTNLESLSDVRRLLRRQLPTTLAAADRERVVSAIRSSSLSPRIRLRELSDLRDWGNLSADELGLVQVAETEGKLREPIDLRTEPLFRTGHGLISSQPRHEMGWPHAEDDKRIRLLGERRNAAEAKVAAGSGVDAGTIARSEALVHVLARQEAKTEAWLATTLSWCSELVHALRNYMVSQLEAPRSLLQPSAWEKLLNEYTPWWREMLEVAIESLLGPCPASHTERIPDGQLTWSSNDIFMRAANFVNSVLASAHQPPFSEFQARLEAAVCGRWSDWPPFSRATILASLETWYFVTYPELEKLLAEIVRTEPNAAVVRYAVDHLLWIAESRSAPELGDLLVRVKLGGHDDSLGQIAQLLGRARIVQTLPDSRESFAEIGKLLDLSLADNWPEPSTLKHFLRGVLIGAREALNEVEDKTKSAYEAWLHLVGEVVDRWPFDSEVVDGSELLPLDAICSVVEDEPNANERTTLFLKLVSVIETILRRGNLGAFCDLHFTLKDLISGTNTPKLGDEKRQPGVVVSESTEHAFAKLCRCSVERVVQWQEAGTQSNDLGWAGGLRGEESVELVERCMSAAGNRNWLKIEMVPLVDLLVKAGQPERAAELRIRLRKF